MHVQLDMQVRVLQKDHLVVSLAGLQENSLVNFLL